jgi:UDP-GlcNAc:undecaprenyl-phosphate GlcNAc-1-phosphate transferase
MSVSLLYSMILAAVLAALVAVGITPSVKKLAVKARVVRAPRGRDAHETPTPLWGGLAMFAGFMIAVFVLRLVTHEELSVSVGKGQHPVLGILLGASLVDLVGLLDDKYDLPPKLQAGALLLGGLIAALLGARINGVTNPFAPLPSAAHPYSAHNFISLGVFSIPITMAWVFLVAKTFDFLDGLDGLAAGVCAIAAMTMGLMAARDGDVAVAVMGGALVGACLGFLRYNYNPASIFMGTVGAQFLGFVLAMLAIVGAFKIPATISLIVPLLVLGVPVFDGLYVIARRLYLRQAPQVADRTHIHHRFRDRGLSVKAAVWSIYGLTAVGCLLALILAWKWAR